MRERIGKFEIVRRLGQGSMGEVYLARDPSLDREVALKTIRLGSAFGAEATARFEREARAAGALNHPNVVTVYEFGQDQGLYYLAMEYVAGGDLEGVLRARQGTPAEQLDLLAQACEGLGYAHERGIVHRDIKPANILVSRIGRHPVAKLVDFGVALVGHSDLTQQGSWMGTVNYMAPEYLDSGQAGPASDLFAMGVILYEILTGGRRPFAGETATAVLTAILRQPPAPFRPEEVEELNPGLLAVVDRALAKQPGDRFGSAEDLAAAIRSCLAGPAPAPPAPAPAGGQTLVVGRNGKGQCLSLRVALRQAEPGARILVMPGVYREPLVLDKAVTLAGQGGPAEVVLESVKGPCLVLDAAGIQLENLLVQHLDAESGPALVAARGTALLTSCEVFARNGPAVRVDGPGAEPVFRDCTLRGSGPLAGVVGERAHATFEACRLEGGGLGLEPAARATLVRCRIQNAEGVGLALDLGARADLEECQFSGQEAGAVAVEADARAELVRCRIGEGTVGLLVLEHGQADLTDCELTGLAWAGIHAVAGAAVQARGCRITGNPGLGASVEGAGLLALERCELAGNGEPAVRVQGGGTVQMKGCRVFDGGSFGVVCARQGRGVLEGCEIYGNAGTGAKVEPGGSLLLVRCDLRDGRDTGILLFEDADVTLEECVVHRNARGGILLAKHAADPVLRGGNRIQDTLLRSNGEGGMVRVQPLR